MESDQYIKKVEAAVKIAEMAGQDKETAYEVMTIALVLLFGVTAKIRHCR